MNDNLDELVRAFSLLKNEKEIENFLLDLCTPQELRAMAERWEIAQLLNQENLSYRAINAKTKASTATITRVARFLKTEDNQGYKTLLNRI